MQIDVFAFVEVQRQKVDANAAAAIGRLLEARDDSPPRAVGAGDIGEKVVRRARGGGRAQRKGASGESAQPLNPGPRQPFLSAASRELPGPGASIVQRCDNFL